MLVAVRVMLLATLSAFLCVLPTMAIAQWHYFSAESMTTRLSLNFWCQDKSEAEQIKQAVLALFDDIYRSMSAYREDSELYRLNQRATTEAIRVSEPLFEVLTRAWRMSKLTDGAFDLTFGSVGFDYDYRQQRQPSSDYLAKQVALIDYRAVQLDANTRRVRYATPGLKVGVGGIAKGFAVDRAIALLAQRGIRHAQVSAGGDLRLLGDKRGLPWMVGIQDPRQSGVVVRLPLSDVAVSTSGDYERFFINEQGERVHHIISPEDGRPAKGLQSVTVIGPESSLTDGLSTAVFVLGLDKGLALIERIAGVDAIIIDAQRKLHFSSGLSAPKP